MYHPENLPKVSERDLAMSTWLKIWIEMGYPENQITLLLQEYFGENWKDLLA